MRNTFSTLGLIAILLSVQHHAGAQEPGKPEAAKPAAAPRAAVTPLKLLITISRYQGEKKISSLPYSVSLAIGGSQPRVNFNIGAQVPYATTQATDTTKTPAYSYRDVGVGIVVSNQTILGELGLHKMDISVENSTLSSSSQIQGAPTITGVPIFRTFSSSGTVILRDGQTTQLTAAADPITGETMRVDVTLTVVK